MALENDNMVMPVAPAYGGGLGGFGGFGGDGSWLILFLLIAMLGGGWGNGFGGMGGGYDFPWLLNGQAGINQNTNAGFDNAAVMGQL